MREGKIESIEREDQMYLCKQRERDMEIGEIFQYEKEKKEKERKRNRRQGKGRKEKEKRREKRLVIRRKSEK